jgi:voltage-gated potassium channel Kch
LARRLGLRDLGDGEGAGAAPAVTPGGRILLVGFFREASSLLEELIERDPALAARITVVDFNPVVYETLRRRDIHVVYGDVSQREALLKAGAAEAALLVCTVPESLLKGITNEKLARQLRAINPQARIIMTTDVLAGVSSLRDAGADFVYLSRLGEARDLADSIQLALQGRLDQCRQAVESQLKQRQEVLP